MDIKSLMNEAAAELDEEREIMKSTAEQTLHAVAQKLLILERDLNAPGVTRSAEERVERLLEAIAKESF